MKKLLTKFIILFSILISTGAVTLAGTVDTKSLLPKATGPYDELKAVAALPEVTITQTITIIIKTILGWSMLITLVVLVFMGIYYLQSLGNEDDLSKVKNMMVYLVIGMAIMAAAYGVIVGVAQFDFFN